MPKGYCSAANKTVLRAIQPREFLNFAAGSEGASCLEVPTSAALFTLQLSVPFTCLWKFKISAFLNWDRDSSVGIATRYGLGSSGGRSTVGARFSATIQTVPGAHPTSHTMGTLSLSRGLSGRDVALTVHPHLAPRLKKE